MSFLNFSLFDRFPISTIVLWLLIIAIFVQLAYILVVFTKLLVHKKSNKNTENWPPVSIIVCAHNEEQNLRELLPILNSQDYSEFDIHVLDDRSTDGTMDFLCNECGAYDKMRFWRFDKEHDHVTPKKYALTAGVRQAKYEIVLLTDADCRPMSKNWLREMVSNMSDKKRIVLGFSPYKKEVGFLNKLIRYETFYTAVQYLSFALFGKPYMGVGRNLMYTKSLFIDNKGYYSHLKVMGGDDDLLMNEIANADNTAICIEPEAFSESIPKKSWAEWLTQKERHLSVGKYYKSKNKQILGFLSATHILSWVLFYAVVFISPFIHSYRFLGIGIVAFCLRLLVQWLVFALINKRLKNTIEWYLIPVMDFVMFVYYVVMGVTLWKNRNQKTRWK